MNFSLDQINESQNRTLDCLVLVEAGYNNPAISESRIHLLISMLPKDLIIFWSEISKCADVKFGKGVDLSTSPVVSRLLPACLKLVAAERNLQGRWGIREQQILPAAYFLASSQEIIGRFGKEDVECIKIDHTGSRREVMPLFFGDPLSTFYVIYSPDPLLEEHRVALAAGEFTLTRDDINLINK